MVVDVRIKIGGGPERASPSQEILTGLRDGSLRSLFDRLVDRHPEYNEAIASGALDTSLLDVLVNNRHIRDPQLGAFALKDGDTVDLVLKGPATPS